VPAPTASDAPVWINKIVSGREAELAERMGVDRAYVSGLELGQRNPTVGAYLRGDAGAMRESADAALADAETRSDAALACNVHRIQGVTHWIGEGDIANALVHLKQSVALHDPDRDREPAFRFGQDIGVSAKAYLASVTWASGEPDRGRALIKEMLTRANKIGHFPTLAYAHYHAAWFETTRLDAGRAKTHVETSAALAQEHGVSLWQLIAPVIHGWTVATLHNAQAGTDEMRRGIASCREQGVRSGSIWFLPLLALMQAKAGEIDQALETSTSAFAELDGGHCWDAEAHRIRGEILLKRDPANTPPAEEAFLTAITVAQRQKTRSFGLRAALSLAKLYRSTNRPADAHAVLLPALEGFSPTRDFPEIEEAQLLVAAVE
jgi:predicted ATPase